MPKPIVWSTLSEKDFESILDYLQKNWNKDVAHQFIEITVGLINQISIHPKQFPVIHKGKKVRECVISRHNTLFTAREKNLSTF